MNDHQDIYAAESAALVETDWERWITRVENLMCHDADGDLTDDGYSLDTFRDLYEAGLTAEAASTRIRGALFVTGDGTTYRLAWTRWERMPLADEKSYTECFDILTDLGHSRRYELPAAATLVWAPDRGVTQFGICGECGNHLDGGWLTSDEWRSSGMCGLCLNGYTREKAGQ